MLHPGLLRSEVALSFVSSSHTGHICVAQLKHRGVVSAVIITLLVVTAMLVTCAGNATHSAQVSFMHQGLLPLYLAPRHAHPRGERGEVRWKTLSTVLAGISVAPHWHSKRQYGAFVGLRLTLESMSSVAKPLPCLIVSGGQGWLAW